MTGTLRKIGADRLNLGERMFPESQKSIVPPEPSPIPRAIPGREEEEAKKKVKRRGKGRESTRLARRMMTQRASNNLRQILG